VRWVQISLSPDAPGFATFRVHSRLAHGNGSDDQWTLHATGRVNHQMQEAS
jgi:hypothetical protein